LKFIRASSCISVQDYPDKMICKRNCTHSQSNTSHNRHTACETNTSRPYQLSYLCTEQTLCTAHQPYAGHCGFNAPSAPRGVCCESQVPACCSSATWTQSMPGFCSHLPQAVGQREIPQVWCKKEGKW